MYVNNIDNSVNKHFNRNECMLNSLNELFICESMEHCVQIF